MLAKHILQRVFEVDTCVHSIAAVAAGAAGEAQHAGVLSAHVAAVRGA